MTETVSVPTRRRRGETLTAYRPRVVGETGVGRPAPTPSAAALLGAELEEQTRTELVAFVPEPGTFDRLVPPDLFSRLLRRGKDVRVLHGHPAGGDPVPFPTLARVGIAAPSSFALPYPVLVRDRSVLYTAHPDPRHPLARRLTPQEHGVAAKALAFAFDLAWAAASQVAPAPQPPFAEITAEQREILQVLGSGLTDDHAAAQLHISRRTFARRVAALMDALGATSRFQVGAQAVRRGLI